MKMSPRLFRSRSFGATLAAVLVATGLSIGVGGGSAQAAPASPAASAVPAAAAAGGARVAPRAACDTRARAHRVTCFARFRTAAEAGAAGVAAPSGLAAAVATTSAQAGRGPAVPKPTAGYGPADIASIYALDTTKGAGQTVAIVDAYDNPNAEADLAAFRSAYGLPACTTASGCLRRINQRGGSAMPTGDPGWGVEIDLDIQAVSAACPKCKILFVGADSASFDDIGAAVNQAVAQGAKIVSNSYGGSEFNGVLALATKYYAHPGVAQVASSGDAGFTDASFPSSLGNLVSVGGTSVVKAGTTWTQSAWSGAGSGCSAWVAKPSWQKDRNCLMRTTSDVSALADPDTGFAVYDTYGLAAFGLPPGWLVVGGTSLSTPLISGMIALAGNAPSLATAQYLYKNARGLRDVVGGSNGYCGGDYLCTGLPGYDGPTGLGTPNGVSAL